MPRFVPGWPAPFGGGSSGRKTGVQFFHPGFGYSRPRPAAYNSRACILISTRLKEKDTNMNGPARITVLAIAVGGMVLSMSGCNRLAARDQLNKGVEAYKSARYEEAIGHFQKATQLDPSLPMAKSYLATALAQNVVPGLETAENLKTAEQAIDIFKEVLVKTPNDVNSLKQIAGIYFQIKKLDQAKEWQKKVLAADPKDP